jgi:tight adherence protein B
MSSMLLLIIGGGIVLIVLIVGLVITRGEEKQLVDERLGRYLDEQEAASSVPAEEKTSFLAEWLTGAATRFSWGQKISKQLAQADLKLKVGEYLAVNLLVIAGVAFIAWWFGGRSIFSAMIGGVVGFFIPGFYVNRQKGKRLQRFDEQLSDMLNLMVNGLRAGYSTMQALEAVSRELPSPISDEFHRVVQEMQLGIPMERALDNLWRRIPSGDLDFVITAMNVQRETGGNLSEILENISHTIRERVKLKGEIRVLTAQVVFSGRFLSALPVLLLFGIYFLNRPYIMNFFNPDSRIVGIAMLIGAAILIVVGYATMNKIADIKI